MTWRLLAGLTVTAAAFWLTGRRLLLLYRLGRLAQPVEPDRAAGAGTRLRAEVVEVLGQRRLLRWSLPGLAHLTTFWGFLLLGLTIVEGFGALFVRDFALPWIGREPWLGALEDTVALVVLVSVAVFAAIRLRHTPRREGRRSRFFGSHLDGAWIVLWMIVAVVGTLFAYRAAQVNTGYFPFRSGAYASEAVARLLAPLGTDANAVVEHVGVVLALAVIGVFLVIVVHSKHLHVGTAVVNVALARRPRLGAVQPVRSGGHEVDFDDPADDDLLGRGRIEDFTWKGLLDLASCTECGRCQSQCPAWNTGKPLSPKLMVMALRDHALAKAPYLLAADDTARDALPPAVRAEGDRPLVGDTGWAASGDVLAAYGAQGAVLDVDVLWSCTTCGACVEQCPVDIEHVDHVVDLRRHQMLMESAFPEEAGDFLRNLEHAGDPWGRGPSQRLAWAEPLPFRVRVLGEDGREAVPDQLGEDGRDAVPDDVEYLLWVGCAGALDDAAQRTTRAVATLLHEAGVEFAVLGEAETCTGDAARRAGNEFLFQLLARQNVGTLDAVGARRIVVTCAHCFNALANEYPQVGGRYQVVHHTQLLADLVAAGRLTPMAPVEGTLTYHDACYLGRHNRVFEPPRELLAAIPGARVRELPRHRERSFCCGAGGARMFLDETLGTRISGDRAGEALAAGADVVASACPFCLVMLTDGVAAHLGPEPAAPVEVTDVAELLLRSVRPGPSADAPADRPAPAASRAPSGGTTP